MEQGPDELDEQTPEGFSAGADAPSQQAPANEEPESLDDTAMQRPPSDS